MIEKHLDIVSQTHQKMRDLQEKIIEPDEWRSTKKDIPISLPSVKSYDIKIYTMAKEECQDLGQGRMPRLSFSVQRKCKERSCRDDGFV